MPLKAIALNCTLKVSAKEASSTDRISFVARNGAKKHDVETEVIRLADSVNLSR